MNQHERVSAELRRLFQERDNLKAACRELRAQVQQELERHRTTWTQLEQAKRENTRLRIALESCADELEGQVAQCYHGEPVESMHPVTRRAFERDMAAAHEARAAAKEGRP